MFQVVDVIDDPLDQLELVDGPVFRARGHQVLETLQVHHDLRALAGPGPTIAVLEHLADISVVVVICFRHADDGVDGRGATLDTHSWRTRKRSAQGKVSEVSGKTC